MGTGIELVGLRMGRKTGRRCKGSRVLGRSLLLVCLGGFLEACLLDVVLFEFSLAWMRLYVCLLSCVVDQGKPQVVDLDR